MGRALPVFQLDDISVASPCSMAWGDMVGGDKVRFCGACQKNVFNLSGMARSEALDLVRATDGKVCVRFFRRADGTVLTEDCPVGIQKALKRAKRVTLGALATSLGACAALITFLSAGMLKKPACQLQSVQAQIEQIIDEPADKTMGKIAMPQDTPPPRAILGEAVAPPPHHEVKGRMKAPPKPPPREIMGDVALPSGG